MRRIVAIVLVVWLAVGCVGEVVPNPVTPPAVVDPDFPVWGP
jgi:hypothetical protein